MIGKTTICVLCGGERSLLDTLERFGAGAELSCVACGTNDSLPLTKKHTEALTQLHKLASQVGKAYFAQGLELSWIDPELMTLIAEAVAGSGFYLDAEGIQTGFDIAFDAWYGASDVALMVSETPDWVCAGCEAAIPQEILDECFKTWSDFRCDSCGDTRFRLAAA